MTKFTKERLEQYIKSPLEHGLTRSEQMEMARQLLTGLEQGPVAYISQSNLDALSRGHDAMVKCTDNVARPVALYAAPQLPQPAVDQKAVESLATDLMKRIDKITGERHSVATLSSLRVSIVEACRAAMLQGAEPVQGWIPCSERMPVENDIVLVVDDGYFVCEAQYREGDFFSAARGKGEFFETTCRDVELWMPLPAAPQQEEPNRIQEERVKIQEEVAMGARLTKHRFKVK